MSQLIKEIHRDIYHESPWCYVKLQTLLESATTHYLQSKKVFTQNLTLKPKIDLMYNHSNYLDDYTIFEDLIHRANLLKHQNSDTVKFDVMFLREYYIAFNKLVTALLPDSLQYRLDASLFERNIHISNSMQIPDNKQIDPIKPTLSTKKINNIIHINCGVGAQDFGFEIKMKPYDNKLSAFENSVYATIFNFLQRSANATKNQYISRIEIENGNAVQFAKVYRYQMLLLTMLRAGAVRDNVIRISAQTEDMAHIQVACQNLNHYAKMLATLCGNNISELLLDFSDEGIAVSHGKPVDGFTIIDNTFIDKNDHKERTYWFASNLLFNVNINCHEPILMEFLNDFFGYTSFKEGQLEAIVNTLNSSERTICILPTGGGKSIVFYMNAFLSPCPTIVIAPTLILARDQIRNLNECHNIDDAYIYTENPQKKFSLCNKLIYMTPGDLQSFQLIKDLITYNTNYMISNVILDEIHTLCNWSHDFRPDYLLLFKNLFTFVDHCRYIGFTATANYKVLHDLTKQLKIDLNSVIQPLAFDAGDFTFQYIGCSNEQQQLQNLVSCVENFIINRETADDKMIIFTRSTKESNKLSRQLANLENYETSCFDAEHTYSYAEFLSDTKHILIADSGMGIGINLPKVTCVLHYGLPNSKAQYAQEIGRANRRLNKGCSIVLFIDNHNLTRQDRKLISFETPIDEIVNIIRCYDSNLSSSFMNILGSTESYASSAQEINNIFDILQKVDNYTTIEFKKTSLQYKDKIQKYLYTLSVIGIIDNWYFKGEDSEKLLMQIEVDFKKNSLAHVKECALKYLNMMGQFGKYTHHISHSTTVKDIIYIFQTWFYEEFLRYHREQLLNVVEFFNFYTVNNNREDILKELKDYFSVSLKSINDNKDYLLSLTQEEILKTFLTIGAKTIAEVEELLSNSYNAKLDLLCYLYQSEKKNSHSVTRLLRVIENSTNVDRRNLLENIHTLYEPLSLEDRCLVFSKLLNYFHLHIVVDTLYLKIPKDLIFYGVLASEVNKQIGGYINV